jgi:hypothetical protein
VVVGGSIPLAPTRSISLALFFFVLRGWRRQSSHKQLVGAIVE